jgi:hypothetical protein
MNSEEWVARCAARLHEQWPRVPLDQLAEVASEIQRNAQRQVEEPEHAAVEWLGHAMPDAR